jgi:hypothetical protein
MGIKTLVPVTKHPELHKSNGMQSKRTRTDATPPCQLTPLDGHHQKTR